MKKQQSEFPTRPDTKWSVQTQKQARSLKFWILEEEQLNYPCSENKGADQLRSYCEAYLHLCFEIQNVGFLMRRPSLYHEFGHIFLIAIITVKQAQIILPIICQSSKMLLSILENN